MYGTWRRATTYLCARVVVEKIFWEIVGDWVAMMSHSIKHEKINIYKYIT